MGNKTVRLTKCTGRKLADQMFVIVPRNGNISLWAESLTPKGRAWTMEDDSQALKPMLLAQIDFEIA